MEENKTVTNEEDLDLKDETLDIVKKRIALKNIIMVAISNIFSLAAGILSGFLLPKIMGKVDYSYYKTFALYASYIGILHFGICDGIYLKYAGMTYDELDKSKFGAFTRFFFVTQLIISSISVIVSLLFLQGVYKYIFLFLSVNILAVTSTTYYELISQTTQRFKLVSLRNVLRACLSVVSLLTLVLIFYTAGYSPDYLLYITIVVSINLFLALWYLVTYRKITFGKFDKIKTHKKELISLYKIGIVLLISNYITQVIFVIDQQFVNILFDEISFANYAFAYSLVQLVLVAVNAVATVIYPTLNSTSDENVKENYGKINFYFIFFMVFAIFAYYPLHWFINFFLDNYTESLPIFRVILPGVAISSAVTAIKANIYKKLKHIPIFLLFAVITLVLSIVINIIAYLIFKSMLSISIATVVTNLIWYIVTDLFLYKKYKVNWVKNFIFMILVFSVYYLVYLIPTIYVGGLIYLLSTILLSIVFYRGELKDILLIFKRRKKNS